ncbi:MAG: Mov34/MPN/PAD-1 family protein [Gammaproteobacteria bacterium]|nr:Mov34/MPN/PAD-1 family protein [Gammaproteobacteria bacterium]
MTSELVDELLWLPEPLQQEQILTDIATHHPNETGGMLLGYVNGNQRVVTALIGAGPNAEHEQYRMLPDNGYQQAMLREHFENTNGRESFLGEWHSHPESAPIMSWTDRRTLHRVTTRGKHLPALPVMMIAGVETGDQELSFRVYRRRDMLRRMWLDERHFVEMSIQLF